MRKRTSGSSRLPAPVGPYSAAVIADGLVFCSGLIALDRETGELITGGIAEQVRCILENLRSLLEDVGSGLEMVTKTTVFLTSMEDFGELNRVYGEFFAKDAPARTTAEVSRLPKGAAVEIEAIALLRA